MPPRPNPGEPENRHGGARQAAPFLKSGSPRLGRGGLVLLALLLCGGCGAVQETAAHKIADKLPAALGPADRYDVQVDGDPLALTRGRARAVHVQGVGVKLSPALTLDTLTADVQNVSFDTKTRRLTHLGRAAFTASLSQANLARYLAQSKSSVPGLVVTLLPDSIDARVPVSAFGFSSVAALAGTLRPHAGDPSRLDFDASGAQVGRVALPAGLVNLALDTLNPLLDLGGLKVPLSVESAKVQGGKLVLAGTADLSGLVPK